MEEIDSGLVGVHVGSTAHVDSWPESYRDVVLFSAWLLSLDLRRSSALGILTVCKKERFHPINVHLQTT